MCRDTKSFPGTYKKIDTCGIFNLHGLPGLFGGLVAIVAVDGISKTSQMMGILITIVFSIVSGLLAGKILSFTGRRKVPYVDSEEFLID
ncbi:MAG: hypothetical protein GQ565_00655 [Candidatus Aegiribacteria sp.]|nr:hypothetical protein [Candidatus Aegiribacteria sp.]